MMPPAMPPSYIVPGKNKKRQKVVFGIGIFLLLFLGPFLLRPFLRSGQPMIDTVTPIVSDDDFLFDIDGNNFLPDTSIAYASNGGTTTLPTTVVSKDKVRVRAPRTLFPSGTTPSAVIPNLSVVPPSQAALVISGLAVKSKTSTSATIEWFTNRAADSKLSYGTSASFGASLPLAAALVTIHTMTLSGLTPSTDYYYRVESKESATSSALAEGTFKTSAVDGNPDTTGPVISDVHVVNITANGATVEWVTDEASTSKVEYGTTTALGRYALSSSTSLMRFHPVGLIELVANTKYFYRVISADANGKSTTSTPLSEFTTLSREIPPEDNFKITSGPLPTSVGANRAILQWTTSVPSTRTVECGETTTYLGCDQEPGVQSLVTDHVVIFKNLKPNTEYHYRIVGVDAQGTQLSAEDRKDRTFQTTQAGQSSGGAKHQITSGPNVEPEDVGPYGFIVTGTTSGG